MPVESPSQLLFVRDPSNSPGGWRPSIAFATNLKLGRAGLAQSRDRKAQGAILDFGFQHAAHGISLRRPKMKQAAVVLAGDGILGLRQIKCHGAIFQHHRSGGFAEKILHGASQCLRCHRRRLLSPISDLSRSHFRTDSHQPSVTYDHRHTTSVDVSAALTHGYVG
jgi:hypothetical protein